jgi:RHS repeat-associated protein
MANLLWNNQTDFANFEIKKAYIYANSQILAENDGANKYFYMHDRLGSVRQVINSNGAVVKMFTFNPFGEKLEEEGSFYTPWQFTGQYLDSETGQYYLRARMYNPYLSRFTTYDSVAGKFENPLTWHRYLYCQNDPINKIDPDGREIRLGWAKPNRVGWATDCYHTLLQIIPENQGQYFKAWGSEQFFNIETMQIEFTIDAGPHNPAVALVKDNLTYLEARVTGPSDNRSNPNDDYYPNTSTYDFEKLDLYGKNEDYAISALLGAYDYYRQRNPASYELKPQATSQGYNSNSFISGLLKAVGLDCYYGVPVLDPGWNKPLPEEYFRKTK